MFFKDSKAMAPLIKRISVIILYNFRSSSLSAFSRSFYEDLDSLILTSTIRLLKKCYTKIDSVNHYFGYMFTLLKRTLYDVSKLD